MKSAHLKHWFALTVVMMVLCGASGSPDLLAASVPATILTQPEDQTAIELLSATFSVVATGNPPARLQWFRNDQAIANATNTTYTLLSTVLGDEGSIFRVEARNTVTNVAQLAVSSNALLHITADTTSPLLLSATTLSPTLVQLGFSEGIWPSSASGLAQYTITGTDGDLTVTNVAVVGNRILLGTTPAKIGSFYLVRVQGVRDLAAAHNQVLPDTQLSFQAVDFNSQDVGNPALSGSTTAQINGYDLRAAGTDIGGKSDQFQFNYQLRQGDFDVKVRVESLSLADAWSKAGLMARQTLTSNSIYAASLATPSVSGSFFQWRSTTNGGTSTAGSFPVNYPQTWLRLRRTGNTFTGFAGYDGTTWVALGSTTMNVTNSLYVGLAASSRNPNQTVLARFRDLAEVTDDSTVSSLILPIEPIGPSSRKTGVAITEIMYHPKATNTLEFVELYNSNPFFEDIGGWRISGDIDYTFPPNTVMQGGAFLVVARNPEALKAAYSIANVMGPYTNSLKNSGVVQLLNQVGAIYLEVPYSDQNPWPIGADGTGHSIVLVRPSFGEGFPQAWAISDVVGGSPGQLDAYRSNPLRNVVINEFLAHTAEAGLSDYIELYNHSNQAVDLSGCVLTDDPVTNYFVIPAKTVIPARGFLAFDESQMGFSLKASGETIYFKNPDLTRVLDAVRFEPQANGVSFGRHPDGAADFYPLEKRTPGQPNGSLLIRDIVINELMYKPISGDNNDEYVELYNKGSTPVNLGGWQFTAGISFTFPVNVVLAPDRYLVVAKNATTLLSHHPKLNAQNTIGDYGGSLGNRGERVALSMPEPWIRTSASGVLETNIIHVVADEVTYGTGSKWGKWANEGGSSLELIDPRGNHRLAANWADSDETQKAPWTVIEASGVLDLGSGTANKLEIGLLGEGECLLDDAEVIPAGSTNVVGNSSFEKGLTSWVPQGNHVATTLDNKEGYNSQQSLHIRASARGDTGANCVRVPLIRALSQNQTSLIRAKTRWLRGWPEIVMRLSGNFLEATGRFTVPQNLGTPGERNSQALPNASPSIYAVTHSPILPAANEPVVVTARVDDPDGISALTLNYREDPIATLQSIAMADDGTGGDAVAGDGLFSATIPGKPANTLVAFHIKAVDASATPVGSVFPVSAPTRECLVRFGDPTPIGAFATYRQWYTQKAVATWKNRPVLSNERVEGTFVYNNYRVIYGHSAKYSGSPYHQEFSSPETSGCHYSVEFPLDDILLGTENFNKIHAPGNGSFDDTVVQREQTCYWLARQLGLPWNYRRFVNMYFNGNRKGGAASMMEDTQTPGTDVIASVFPNDPGGSLYKLQPWFEFTDPVFPPTGAASFSNVGWCTLDNFTTTGGVKKLARYRWNYLTRAANGTANDYDNVYDLIDAANAPTGGSYVANIEKLADIEEWMRIFAVVHAVGDWDHYGSQNSQNMYGYKPVNGKWQLMIWDLNIVLGNSGSWGAGENLFNMSGTGANMTRMLNHPHFRRMYLRSLKEVANGPMTATRVNPILDAKYAAMITSGINPQDPAPVKSYIVTARGSIISQVKAEDSLNFQLNGTNAITSDNNLILLSGVAPVDVKTIQVNGVEYPVIWSNTKTWNLRLIAPPGTNSFAITGYDRLGKPFSGAATNLTINYTGAVSNPSNVVVISEVMYNPVTPDASFVEIYNRSATASFDLSQWRLRGLSFTFPAGTVLSNGQFLVVCKDMLAFSRAYNPAVYVAGEFPGQLDPAGKTLTLVRPGLNPGEEIIVNRVRYEARLPWPQAPNGQGPSLQLIDASQDNSRVSNWHGSEQIIWQFVSYTNILGSTRLSLQLDNGGGDLYLDDLSLVQGSLAPGTGDNVILNGDFESETLAPWVSATLGTNSQLTSTYAHTGGKSLHLIFNRGTVGLTNFYQDILSVTTGTNYTFSFWYLVGEGGTNFNARMGSAFKPSVSIKPVLFTPGGPNTYTDTLPPYPAVWLNELQAQNTGSLADNHGEPDPWIELYNAGPNSVSLDGFYLAGSYSKLTEWAFPAQSSLAPGQFKVLFADGQPGQSTPSEWHTSFRLAGSTGSVALVRLIEGAPQILDYLNYSGLAPGESHGSYPDGQPFDRQVFYYPTPGTPNDGAAPPLRMFINEWMASNTKALADPAEPAPKYDDWFELYNAGTSAADLTGYFLTDSLNNKRQFEIPAGYPIPAKGYLLVWADNETNQNSSARADLHVNFQLAKGGEQVGLYTPDGTAVDTVSFGAQTNDISQGRWPDGAPALYFMPTPTPRSANVIPGHENMAPVLAPIGNKVVPEISLLSFQAQATDADLPAQQLTYTLGAAPSGASITTDGHFHWRPVEAQGPGTYEITVRVTDNGTPPMSASQTFQVMVLEVNTPPYFIDTLDKHVKAGSLLSFATAADTDLPPQILSFALEGAPAGAKVDPVTGLFSWTPATSTAAGLYPATVRVSDNGTPPYTVRQTYSIQVVDQGETLVVVTIGRTGNTVHLSWGTTPGKTYRLLYKDQLGQAVWKTLGNDLLATGSSLSVNDTPSGQRIYRISQLD